MVNHIRECCVVVAALFLGACNSGGSSNPVDNSATAGQVTVTETTAGSESGGTGGATGTDSGGTSTTGSDTGVIDIGGTDTGETDSGGSGQITSLAQAIQGAWMGVCSNHLSLGVSDREINAITSTQIIQDFYEYDGNDCQGVPRGKTFPLRIYDYVLGSDIVSDEGISGAQLDLVVTQVSDVGFLRDGVVLGEQFYDVIGVDDNGILRKSYSGSRNLENRPTSLPEDAFMVQRTPLTESTISPQELVGTYSSGCLLRSYGSSIITEILDEDGTLTGIEEMYFNDNCSGAAGSRTERTTEYVFGDTFTSVFGDTLIRFVSTQNPKAFVFGAENFGDDFNLGQFQVRYEAGGLAGDTWLRGYCLVNSSDCGKFAEFQADMLDLEFSSDIRYKRVAQLESMPN